jgi:hypothetical protein
VPSSREDGDEILGSIKGGELDELKSYLFLRQDIDQWTYLIDFGHDY